jgi:hypothetical protein
MSSNKEFCPSHHIKMNKSRGWRPPNGLDPKMIRLACPLCNDDYWYKAPKRTLMRRADVQAAFGIDVL